ncbi:MAG: hypothetical protein PHS27_02075, partial [Candidatus Pacebacteria bacterium]|nr:hypothetical protein [Candidatus Paceibacterota bacterium]
MQIIGKKILGLSLLFLILGVIFVPIFADAGITGSTSSPYGIDSIDINKVGESSKNFLQKMFDKIENWWNSQGSSWVKNIYYKIVLFL